MTGSPNSHPFATRTIPSRLADQDLPEPLRENFSDRAAAVLRAVTNELPVGGALVAELIGRIIPNQREERICAFITRLAHKVEEAGQRLDEVLANLDAEKVALFEDGAAGAVKATTAERIEHLVGLVARGLGENGREAEDQRVLVRLLNDLTEADLRYLMSWTKRYHDDRAWRSKHGFDVRFEDHEVEFPLGEKTIKVNQPIPVGDVMDPIVEMAVQGRLEAAGLFERRIVRADENQFDYDFNISDNGLALLRKLDLIGSADDRAYAWQVRPR